MSAKYKSPSFLLPNELNTSTNPSLSADRASNYSMDFNGSDEYINLGTQSSFQFGTQDFSICVWFYPKPSTAWDSLLDIGGYGTTDAFVVYAYGGSNQMYLYKPGAIQHFNSLNYNDNEWNFFAVSKTGNNATGYIANQTNPTLVSQTLTTATGNWGGANATKIGVAGATNHSPFEGKIDEVAIFNKSLTSANITSLYNSGSPASSATVLNLGAIAYYPLGEQAQNSGYLSASGNEWQFPNGVLQDYVMDFNASSSFNSSSALFSGANKFTISFWVNLDLSLIHI